MALTGEELIYNLALGYVGEAKVEDTAASRLLKQYLLCQRYYDLAREEVLKAHPWNEAKERVIIVQDAVNPIFGYDRRYSKPEDSLRVLSVNDSLGSDRRNKSAGVCPWELEKDFILTNVGTAPPTWATDTEYIVGQFVTDSSITYRILANHTSDVLADDVTAGSLVSSGGDFRIIYVEYIFLLTDTTKYTPKLKQAIAMKLAIKIITALTNDIKGKRALMVEFEQLTMPKARSVDGAEGTPKQIFNSEWIRSRQIGTQTWP